MLASGQAASQHDVLVASGLVCGSMLGPEFGLLCHFHHTVEKEANPETSL